MSEMELNAELLETLGRLSEAEVACSEVEGSDAAKPRTDLDGVRADAVLVKRCVAGKVDAWEVLYDQCHGPLLRSIEHILGGGGADPNLVDELAARVWYTLVADDGKMLAKFDARRGARLGTFLRCIAKDVTAGYFRTEYRRRRREQAVGEQRHTHSASAADEADMADFINTLTPGEQEFLDQYLLGEEPADGHRKQYSSTNIWKRASRIRKKLRRFFRGDPGDR